MRRRIWIFIFKKEKGRAAGISEELSEELSLSAGTAKKPPASGYVFFLKPIKEPVMHGLLKK